MGDMSILCCTGVAVTRKNIDKQKEREYTVINNTTGEIIMADISVQHQNVLRYHNSKSVIQIIQQNQGAPISRADIAKRLQMSPTSITRIIASLMDMNLIKQEEAFSKGVGRNGINICLNKEAFYSLGFAIDCDYLKLCILDFERTMTAETIVRITEADNDRDKLLHMGNQIFQEMCREQGITREQVTCMGISCCGLIDFEDGVSRFSPQLGWKNQDIKKKAEEIFGIPVSVDNDIKMALIGATFRSSEMHGADVVYLSIGSGVGVAVMYEGKLIRGINNAAGEIGHAMFSLNGRHCVCGKDGCLSAYISEQGVVRECQKLGKKVEEVRDLMHFYQGGEPWAMETVDILTKDMAIAFCNMIYTYNPKYLLVGGNMVVDAPELFEIAKEKLFDLINGEFNLDIIIKKREYKNNEALGAAFVAQEKYVDEILR